MLLNTKGLYYTDTQFFHRQAGRGYVPWIQTTAGDVAAFVMGKLCLLDAIIRRILPVRLDEPLHQTQTHGTHITHTRHFEYK